MTDRDKALLDKFRIRRQMIENHIEAGNPGESVICVGVEDFAWMVEQLDRLDYIIELLAKKREVQALMAENMRVSSPKFLA